MKGHDQLEDKHAADDGAIHIRMMGRSQEGNRGLSMLTVEVWPVPTELLNEFAHHMKAKAEEWLNEKQVAEGPAVPQPPLLGTSYKGPKQ